MAQGSAAVLVQEPLKCGIAPLKQQQNKRLFFRA